MEVISNNQNPEWDRLIFYHCGRFSRRRRIVTHHHPGCELIYFINGECLNHLEGSLVLPGRPGSILIVPPGMPHSQENLRETETMFVTFSSGLESFEYPPRIIDVEHDALTERWMNDICAMNENVTPASAEMTKGILYALLSRLIGIAAPPDGSDEIHPVLAKALMYMDNHYDRNINIDEVARQCAVSGGYLCALFRKSLNLSPVQHLTRIRLNAAAQQLRNSYLTVGEIAERCGYGDVNYFIRVFRKHLNCTPSEFRRIERTRQKTGTYTAKFHSPVDEENGEFQKNRE